jgi:hypothetical protein
MWGHSRNRAVVSAFQILVKQLQVQKHPMLQLSTLSFKIRKEVVTAFETHSGRPSIEDFRYMCQSGSDNAHPITIRSLLPFFAFYSPS